MRDLVADSHPNLTKLIENFLWSIDDESLEESPNLTLNTADSVVFNSLIVHGVPGKGFVKNRDSHYLLKQAYEISRAYLKNLILPLQGEDKWQNIRNLIGYLRHSTKTILLITSSAANSYRMFETLNDRGLRVSQSDLIKNYVFGQSGINLNQVQQYWTSMKGSLESLDDDDIVMQFIRHALIVTSGFLQQKQIYDKIQSSTKGAQSSLSLLSTWESLSYDYVALSNPESSTWNGFPAKIRGNIKVLNLFDIAPLKPALLAATKKMSKKEVALVFEKFVAIGVRLIIASRTTTQSVEKPLGDCAQRIWIGELKNCKEVIGFLSSSTPNDQQFRDAFERATVSKAQFARYYLRSLERVSEDEPDPWLIPNDDPSTINSEHIFPQKPGNNWPEWDEEQAKAYVKRIGNMVLLKAKDNSGIGSDEFSKKKQIFAKSPYKLTKMVGQEADWLPKNVSDRQTKLADLALKAWPLK